ncbi:MAG: glycosyltransferase family 1 protein [Bacteroidia bacterium]
MLNNLSTLPYTVKSRISEDLASNLLSNEFPILFEVLHTCYLMKDERFKNRFKIYRHSNIEHHYYAQLAKSEKNGLKKAFLKIEAQRLKAFEPIIEHANLILAVNTSDLAYFKSRYPKLRSEYLPSFHPNDTIHIHEGKGRYVLYHGNLSISENYLAAGWLTDHVFSKLQAPVKIAGLNPPAFLKTVVAQHSNIELIENPDDKVMKQLIESAAVHALYTEQATGLKLKLLNVLYSGRFVICNSAMTEGTGFSSSNDLTICDTPAGFIKAIGQKFSVAFTTEDNAHRAKSLEPFSNFKNAELLAGFL